MPARLIGAHMPTGKGLPFALKNGVEIGCTAVQVFTTSPQSWAAKPVTDEMAAAFRAAAQETGLGQHTVSHDSYLINLANEDEEKRQKAIEGLKGEMRRCGLYGIPFVVSHMGAHSGQGEEVGLARVAEATKEVLADTPESVTLLMETTAGQGSSLNHKFEHLAAIIEATGNPGRLAVCLDTCHIFAAGYDIRTAEGYEATFAEFDRLVGCDQIKVIHCNDSKKGLGTRVDRHEHLGEGEIGPVAFQCLVKDPRFEETMIVVETPEAETHHQINVARLWDWARA